MSSAVTEIDITGETCPITFLRAKLALEKLPAGGLLRIRLRAGEPLENVPRSLLDHGHEVLSIEPERGDVFLLTVRRAGRSAA